MITEMQSTSETNVVWWEDSHYEDGSGSTGWKVFTSSFDFPKGWDTNGWEISSRCGMGYTTTVWRTNHPEIVKRDLKYFNITKEGSDRLILPRQN